MPSSKLYCLQAVTNLQSPEASGSDIAKHHGMYAAAKFVRSLSAQIVAMMVKWTFGFPNPWLALMPPCLAGMEILGLLIVQPQFFSVLLTLVIPPKNWYFEYRSIARDDEPRG